MSAIAAGVEKVTPREFRFGAIRMACCVPLFAMVLACGAGQRACCDGISSNDKQNARDASITAQTTAQRTANAKTEGKIDRKGKEQQGTAREAYSFDVGCDADMNRSTSAMEQLAQIGRTCAAGYVSLPVDQRQMKLQRGDCVRAAVAATTREQEVTLRLVRSETGQDGAATSTTEKQTAHVVIERHAIAPFVAPQQGPICVDESGNYVLTATPSDATAVIHATLWVMQRITQRSTSASDRAGGVAR